jgi:ABC-type sugar transport system permease subunit
MGSIVSMPVLPEDNCASQYNVGTLDSIGVAIVWLALLRWIVLHLFGDDINILFCLPNPKRRGTGTHPALLHLVFFIASPIYTIVQAANCRDQLMKLNITTMVFMLIYEHIFSSTKDSLTFNFVCRCRGITLLHLIVISAGAVAVTEGGQWREFGAVVFLLASLLAIKLYQHKEIQGDKLWLIGPAVLMFTFLYPIFLAVFVTLLVNNHGQWTPRPSTVVEYIMLITRGLLVLVALMCWELLVARFIFLLYRRLRCVQLFDLDLTGTEFGSTPPLVVMKKTEYIDLKCEDTKKQGDK